MRIEENKEYPKSKEEYPKKEETWEMTISFRLGFRFTGAGIYAAC